MCATPSDSTWLTTSVSRTFLLALFLAPWSSGAATESASPAALDEPSGRQQLWSADLRLRTEYAHEADLRDGLAVTLRARLGLQTPEVAGFALAIEGEHIQAFGGEAFNSTANERSRFATIADPEATEVNQAYLRWRHEKLLVQAGRMRLALADQRFVGDLNFRQNQQTFDGLMAQYTPGSGHQLRYRYMNRVRRPFGAKQPRSEVDMRTHLVDYELERLGGDRLTLFALLLEMRNRELVGGSTRTLGVRYQSERSLADRPLSIALSYARQNDYADGTNTNDANYVSAVAKLTLANAWVLGAGIEHLGGNGTYGMQTQLATLHKFQGFADLFAAGTPATGVNDWQATLRMPLFQGRLNLAYHWFAAVDSDTNHGREFDFSYDVRVAHNWLVALKFADYRADGFGVDTTRAWLSVTYSH